MEYNKYKQTNESRQKKGHLRQGTWLHLSYLVANQCKEVRSFWGGHITFQCRNW